VRYVYSVLTYVLRPVAFAVVLWRGIGDRGYWQGLGERFGFGAPPVAPLARLGTPSGIGSGARVGGSIDEPRCLWVHAVSLGEVSAAAPLVRALRTRHPDLPLVLTTATPTGRARAVALFGDAVTVRFLPYDTPGAMRRFLARMRPRIAIIMETELWPNLYHQCRRRGVPIVLANARLSARSVSRYRRFGALFRDVFDGDTFVAAQSADDAARFVALGAAPSRTSVMGNLKFDIVVDAASVERGRVLRSAYWPGRLVWIAGSTHAGEEEMVLTAHASMLGAMRDSVPGGGQGMAQGPMANSEAPAAPGVLLLLVPRHPERFQSVADLLNRRGFRFERRSSGNPVRTDAQVLLVDTVGELAALYAAVDVAFVGGSLVPVGGHNVLEPAALGMPVVTGPYQSNAREIAATLLARGALLQVNDATELAARLSELLTDPAARRHMSARALQAVGANRGSLPRLLKLIESLWAPRSGVDP